MDWTPVRGQHRSQSLIQQDCLDLDPNRAILISFDVALVPRHSEALEVRHRLAITVERRALHREHVELQVWLQPRRAQ